MFHIYQYKYLPTGAELCHSFWCFQPLWTIWVRQLGWLIIPDIWKITYKYSNHYSIKCMFQTTNQATRYVKVPGWLHHILPRRGCAGCCWASAASWQRLWLEVYQKFQSWKLTMAFHGFLLVMCVQWVTWYSIHGASGYHMYVCIYIYTYIHIYICIITLYICGSSVFTASMYIQRYACICMYVYIYIWTRMHLHRFEHNIISIYIYTYMYI